jgi:hypothetical protein
MVIKTLIAVTCVGVFALAYSLARPDADRAATAKPPPIEVIEEAAYEPPELGGAASLPAIARRPRPPRPAPVEPPPAPPVEPTEPLEPEPEPATVAPEPVAPPVTPAPEYTPPPAPPPPQPAPEPPVLTFDDSG